MDKKEAFAKSEIKIRIEKVLLTESLGVVANKEELDNSKKSTYDFLQSNVEHFNKLIDAEYEIAKLNCQMAGLIPGSKEIINSLNLSKLESNAINYWKMNA